MPDKDKIALGGVGIGSILCLAGIASSSWSIYVTDDKTYTVGLWFSVVEERGISEYTAISMDSISVEFHTVRICAFLCVILGNMDILFTVLFQGSKTFAVSIITLIAGSHGIAASVIFALTYEENSSSLLVLHGGIKPELIKLSYAFYIFCVGTGFLIVSSLTLCVASYK